MSAPWQRWLSPILWVSILLWLIHTALVHEGDHFSSLRASSNRTVLIPHASMYYAWSSLKDYTHKDEPIIDLATSKEHLTVNVNTSDKAAVIVETRRTAHIVPLILHFSAVLGPDWPIIIYTFGENFGDYRSSAAFARHERSGRIILRSLGPNYFTSWGSVSDFLATDWLWKDLAPIEHILIFQQDSIICSASPYKVEDFFEYDLIGAPITGAYGHGFNGGLSLRRRSTVMRVLEEFDYMKDGNAQPEDQWYYDKMIELRDREIAEGIEDGINIPTYQLARTFAVETIDYPNPLGFHQPIRFIPVQSHSRPLDDWCPEYKLATTDHITAVDEQAAAAEADLPPLYFEPVS